MISKKILIGVILLLACFDQALGADNPEWLGKWKESAQRSDMCKQIPGESDNGIIIFTKNKAVFYESECRIIRTDPMRTGVTRITMKCAGEGETFKAHEDVIVLNNRLIRYVVGEKKSLTMVEYERCQ